MSLLHEIKLVCGFSRPLKSREARGAKPAKVRESTRGAKRENPRKPASPFSGFFLAAASATIHLTSGAEFRPRPALRALASGKSTKSGKKAHGKSTKSGKEAGGYPSARRQVSE